MSGYYTITTADNGKVLGTPLLRNDGNANDFVGASGTWELRDEKGVLYSRPAVWNSITQLWEYAVVAGEFAVGRYWGMVAVTLSGPIGPIYSSEVQFDVIAAD